LLTSHSKQGISNPGMEAKAEETLKPSEAGLREGTPTDIPIVEHSATTCIFMRFDVSTVCHLAQSLAPDILSPSRWEYERILRVPAICGPTLQWLTDSARDLPISMECAGRGYVMGSHEALSRSGPDCSYGGTTFSVS
jgi:hypothetical protein